MKEEPIGKERFSTGGAMVIESLLKEVSLPPQDKFELLRKMIIRVADMERDEIVKDLLEWTFSCFLETYAHLNDRVEAVDLFIKWARKLYWDLPASTAEFLFLESRSYIWKSVITRWERHRTSESKQAFYFLCAAHTPLASTAISEADRALVDGNLPEYQDLLRANNLPQPRPEIKKKIELLIKETLSDRARSAASFSAEELTEWFRLPHIPVEIQMILATARIRSGGIRQASLDIWHDDILIPFGAFDRSPAGLEIFKRLSIMMRQLDEHAMDILKLLRVPEPLELKIQDGAWQPQWWQGIKKVHVFYPTLGYLELGIEWVEADAEQSEDIQESLPTRIKQALQSWLDDWHNQNSRLRIRLICDGTHELVATPKS